MVRTSITGVIKSGLENIFQSLGIELNPTHGIAF